MRCKCGGELLWLYRPPRGLPTSETGTVHTDYAICPECEAVYKQWIESKVHWELMTVQKENE